LGCGFAGEEISQLAKSWATSSDAACERIDSAQLASLQVGSRGLAVEGCNNGHAKFRTGAPGPIGDPSGKCL